MLEQIFKKVNVKQVENIFNSPVYVDVLVTDTVVDDVNESDGISFVRAEKVPFNKLEELPLSKDYLLSDMLKNGYVPKEVPVKGMLSTEFDVASAYDFILSFDKTDSNDDVKIDNNEVVTELPNNV